MEINPFLVEAARETVRRTGHTDGLLELDGVEGIFVAESGNVAIRAFYFFSEGDKRFALGTKRV